LAAFLAAAFMAGGLASIRWTFSAAWMLMFQ
jgi:hypothetical protein